MGINPTTIVDEIRDNLAELGEDLPGDLLDKIAWWRACLESGNRRLVNQAADVLRSELRSLGVSWDWWEREWMS